MQRERVCKSTTTTSNTSKTSKTSNRCKSDLFRCGQLPGSAHSVAAPGHTQQPLLLGVAKASRASAHEEIRRAFNDSKNVHLETDLPKIPKCRATYLPQTKKTPDFEDKGAQLFCLLCCFQGPSHVMLIAELAGTRHLHAAGEFTSQVRVCFSCFLLFFMCLLLSAQQCQETKTTRQPKPLCHESLKPCLVSVICVKQCFGFKRTCVDIV